MNQIAVTGFLMRDPDYRETVNGGTVCNMAIAVKRRYTNADGSRDVDFFDIVAWKGLADTCHKYLAKGDYIGITGTMEQNKYVAKDGTNRTSWKINAAELDFLRVKSFEGKNPVETMAEPVDDEELPF